MTALNPEIIRVGLASCLCLRDVADIADAATRCLIERVYAISTAQQNLAVQVASLDMLIDDACTAVLEQRGSTSTAAALHAITAYRWFVELLRPEPQFGVVGAIEIVRAHCVACAHVISGRRVTNARLN